MGLLVLELHRLDFEPKEWELYDKGIKSLNYSMLKPKYQELYRLSNEVYIILGRDKHYLKKRM